MSVGQYGDLFWNLQPSLVYVAGTEIPVRVYVANLTDEEREYMIMAEISREGVVLAEFPLRVDEAAWFIVEAQNVVGLPGMITSDYSDAVLTLKLYERETGSVIDSIFTALTTKGTEYLPLLPGLPGIPGAPAPTTDIMSMMITMMIVVMMMGMMTKAMK